MVSVVLQAKLQLLICHAALILNQYHAHEGTYLQLIYLQVIKQVQRDFWKRAK